MKKWYLTLIALVVFIIIAAFFYYSSNKLVYLQSSQNLFFSKKTAENMNKQDNTSTLNSTSTTAQNTAVSSPSSQLQPPTMQIDINKTYMATLTTTEGTITVQLDAKQTPKTVNNFVYLSKNNFYNNTIFHRTIKGFMIQGGDPKGDGTGGPGYKFEDEPFEGEYKVGTLAMANSGPNTNGSQFFIMHKDYQLPKNYVIFGKVTDGMEVVNKIAEAPVEKSPIGEMSKPVSPVKILSIEIIEQ